MAKVKVMMNDGKIKIMESHFARALVYCKKAIYADTYKKKVIDPKNYNNKSEKHDEKKHDEKDDELDFFRKKYYNKFNKKCYHGWNLEQIKSKIESDE